MFNFLDLTALGRQEDWEQPPGRSDGNSKTWLRRHDEYEHTLLNRILVAIQKRAICYQASSSIYKY
jgi:hypothetical protein